MILPKIVFIFLVFIFIPTMVLSFLGVQSLKSEEKILAEKIEDKYKSLADIIISQFYKEIEKIGEDVFDKVKNIIVGSDVAGQAQKLTELQSRDNAIDDIFLLTENYQVVYPSLPSRFSFALQNLVIPRLKKAGMFQDEQYSFKHLSFFLNKEPQIIAYSSIPYAGNLIAGFKMNTAYVKEILFKQADIFKDAVKLSWYDGRPLDGAVSARQESLGPPIFSDTIKGYPFWLVSVYERYPEVRQRLLMQRKRLRLYTGMIFLFFVTVFSGGYLALRVVTFEDRLIKIKSNFIAIVSHEIKTPLTSIRMFAETLAAGKVDKDEIKQEYYGIIARESHRLMSLTNNILNYSAIEDGRKKYNFQPQDLKFIVGEIAGLFKTHFLPAMDNSGARSAPLIFKPAPEEIPLVKIDKDAISQAVLNLLFNAVKYSPQNPQIEVSVYRTPKSAVIEVSDHGAGIPKKDQKKIFDKFYRLKNKKYDERNSSGGSGLGLALVKHIVTAHKGKIKVESEEGKGSRFSIILPI